MGSNDMYFESFNQVQLRVLPVEFLRCTPKTKPPKAVSNRVKLVLGDLIIVNGKKSKQEKDFRCTNAYIVTKITKFIGMSHDKDNFAIISLIDSHAKRCIEVYDYVLARGYNFGCKVMCVVDKNGSTKWIRYD